MCKVLRQDDPVLSQQASDLIAGLCSAPNEPAANSMKRLQILLLNRLRRYKLHVRTDAKSPHRSLQHHSGRSSVTADTASRTAALPTALCARTLPTPVPNGAHLGLPQGRSCRLAVREEISYLPAP